MNWLLCLLIFISGTAWGRTRIEGSLPAYPGVQYTLKANQHALNDHAGIVIAEGRSDNSGKFIIEAALDKEQPVCLYLSNTFFVLWAKPNDTLVITAQKQGGYDFSGKAARENSVMLSSGLMQPFTVPGNIGLDSFEPARQRRYLDSIEALRWIILPGSEIEEGISKPFGAFYKAETVNFTLFNQHQYVQLLKGANKISAKDIPENYFDFWKRFSLVEDSSYSNSYQNALQNFIEYHVSLKPTGSQPGSASFWHETFRITDSLLSEHPFTLQKQRSAFLFFLLKYFNLTDLTGKEIELYKKDFPASPSLTLLETMWNKKMGLTFTSPSFSLLNNEGKRVNIQDFRGKVVYIDFWGSWCKACLMNLPYSKKLKEKFINKDVVFLYIDFYDTNEKWLSAIGKYQITGIQLKAEKSDEAYFNKQFNIEQGFPRYALIDKKGSLITVSAPQPQEEAAYELIKKYLEG